MDDRDKKISKPGMPPLPPGMFKPGLPPAPQGGKPSMPAMPQLPGMGGFASPGMPQAPFGNQFSQPAPQQPQAPARDAAAEEAQRMKEEKDKLENKISDMEKLLSQEKEKALLATLKNQQDEALSSRVESSLKDIQEKMRRDRRDHEVEEERLTLKSKIKELETRLSGERETWMQTLKEQLSERETQGKDVEGHFIYRLQEMERRWLDEKAQWQKEIASREETIRSIKFSSEKLRETEDEVRKISMEKSMLEREASKLKDEVARAEREKASIESYIKIIPDKEREIAELRSETAILRGRESQTMAETKHREEKFRFETEKMQGEIGRLQADIGSIADRKNSEKNEEIKKLQGSFEFQLQEKEKAIADVSGEKIRAVSELLKIKGFISRVQAINAVLDKERGQLKLEKMQLAQNMAAQLEEIRRQKQEGDVLRAAHQAELEAQANKFRAEAERARNEYGSELAVAHAASIAELARSHQEELRKMSEERQAEAVKAAAANQAELSRVAAANQAELSRVAAANQAELSQIAASNQAEFDGKVSQLRMKYESASEEEKNAVRRQLGAEHAAQLRELKAELSLSQDTAVKYEVENRRLSAIAKDFEIAIAAKAKEYEDRLARAEAQAGLQEHQVSATVSQRNEAEKAARAAEAATQHVSQELAVLREQQAVLATQKAAAEAELVRLTEELRTESGNRASFESELLFMKQKIQQMELQAQDKADALEAGRASFANQLAAVEKQRGYDAARITEISAELEQYKAVEETLTGRLKWALKGKKE